MKIYTKGLYPNGCPVCDLAMFSETIIFDDRPLTEIIMSAWIERNECIFSTIYSPDGEKQGEFRYEYGRHCVSGLEFKQEYVSYRIVDDGHGEKILEELT